MANANTKLYRQLADGQIFSDPADPGFTVRFKTTSNQKSLNGVSTQNYVTEIIYNDDHDVMINSVNAVDALSVRLRVSGSASSMTRLTEIVKGLAAQVGFWVVEDVLEGFPPTTIPYNPHP